MINPRYLLKPIIQDLSYKMVFIGGPRQVGKTTLAKTVALQAPTSLYLSWDRKADRKRIYKADWPEASSVIVLDELHKYARWKRWIKGEYDVHHPKHNFLVTGSARLDVYRRGGDSLQGRYHYFRLHPFSLNELEGRTSSSCPIKPLIFQNGKKDSLEALHQFGGFPEPIFAQNERVYRRWEKERLERFIKEDVRDLEPIRDFSTMQLLVDLLPQYGGGLLSLNSLREDLEISHRAISHWMDVLEKLYFVFRIRPFHIRRMYTLKKQPKLYFWDWSLLSKEGHRFENMIASHLLKFCHFLEDTEGYRVELFYLRDADKREVDFLVTFNRKPWFAVEAKWNETTPSPCLQYFGEKLQIPFLYQVVWADHIDKVIDHVHVMSAQRFLTALC